MGKVYEVGSGYRSDLYRQPEATVASGEDNNHVLTKTAKALNIAPRTVQRARKAEIVLKLADIEEKRARERQEATLPQKGEKGFQKVNDMPNLAGV